MKKILALTLGASLLLAAAAQAGTPAPANDGLWHAGDAPGTVMVRFRGDIDAASLKAEALRLGIDPASSKERVEAALHHGALGSVDLNVSWLNLRRVLVTSTAEADVNAAINFYKASALVLSAEPDHPTQASSVTINDPLFVNSEQSYLSRTSWPSAVAAYNSGAISLASSVVVAVIDTGIGSHSDINGQVLAGTSFVTEPGAGNTNLDLNGHGTFCAGLIAANAGNGLGIAGAFFDSTKVKILPIKVLNKCGSGMTSDLVGGIAYAVAHGARVISMSITSRQSSLDLEAAVNQARQNGVLLVAAAGNDVGDTTGYPAAYTQALAVGALNRLDQRAFYSNVGKIDLSAPGGDGQDFNCTCQAAGTVNSISPTCAGELWGLAIVHAATTCGSSSQPSCSNTDPYEAGAGTSFATPLVAAAAALLFAQDPNRQVEDVVRILLQTASATAMGAGYNNQTGWGKLNYYGALTYQGSAQSSIAGSNAIKVYNWPNPFSPSKDGLTTLTFFLPSAAPTTLRLLDAGGDLVKRWDLDASKANAGMNLVTWDGRNGNGTAVANGAYTLVVESVGRRAMAYVAVLR